MFGDKSRYARRCERPSSAKAAPASHGRARTTAATAAPKPEVAGQRRPCSAPSTTARQALAAGRTAEAERGFVALTKSNPELAGPYANLGLIYRQAGKTAEAVAALEKAVQLSPQRADLHNQLGITYRMAGRLRQGEGLIRTGDRAGCRTTPPPCSTSAFCMTCICGMASARSNSTIATCS